jgi:hypothetical protein
MKGDRPWRYGNAKSADSRKKGGANRRNAPSVRKKAHLKRMNERAEPMGDSAAGV